MDKTLFTSLLVLSVSLLFFFEAKYKKNSLFPNLQLYSFIKEFAIKMEDSHEVVLEGLKYVEQRKGENGLDLLRFYSPDRLSHAEVYLFGSKEII